MQRLRRAHSGTGRSAGGEQLCPHNLGLFGLFPRDACPSIPPEIILLPFKFIYQMSSWTRAIVIPLSIVHAANPCRPVPAGFNVEELFLARRAHASRARSQVLHLAELLPGARSLSEILGAHQSRCHPPLCHQKCAEWMIEHFEHSDGLGAIYPSMQYAIMALDVLGYDARASSAH